MICDGLGNRGDANLICSSETEKMLASGRHDMFAR